jgi:hypothetical protein
VSRHAHRLVLDNRESRDVDDERTISRALGRRPSMSGLAYEHADTRNEPLLWVADASAWCYGADGEWRQRISGLMTSVTELQRSVRPDCRPSGREPGPHTASLRGCCMIGAKHMVQAPWKRGPILARVPRISTRTRSWSAGSGPAVAALRPDDPPRSRPRPRDQRGFRASPRCSRLAENRYIRANPQMPVQPVNPFVVTTTQKTHEP